MPVTNTKKPEAWSAVQYTKFEKERNRPIYDLLAQIPYTEIKKAIDIGCGPGNSTEILQAHYPEAKVSGMDSSIDMINAAKRRMPNAQFEVADISDWQTNEKYDLILANAALQWVPNHDKVLGDLINKLNKGGSLAIQIPDNFEEPAHRLMRSVADQEQWREKLAGPSKRNARETAEWYFQRLKNISSHLDIWRTTYFHPLVGGAESIVEWFKGTGLRPYLNALNKDEETDFLKEYTSEISKAYHIYPDGTVLLPFPRLFIIVTI